MKIIGGSDFYDGAGMGVDESCVFIRDKAFTLDDVGTFKGEEFTDIPSLYPYYLSPRHKEFFLFLVVVAGEVFPGLRQQLDVKEGMDADEFIKPCYRHTYDVDEAIRWLTEKRSSFRNIFSKNEWMSDREFKRIVNDSKEHFQRSIRPGEADWLIGKKITVLTSVANAYEREASVQVNHACLKDLDFYRAMDPATTHMRIASYLSGVLTSNPETVELSDLSRIAKAGFDKVTSFRKAKTKKKL